MNQRSFGVKCVIRRSASWICSYAIAAPAMPAMVAAAAVASEQILQEVLAGQILQEAIPPDVTPHTRLPRNKRPLPRPLHMREPQALPVPESLPAPASLPVPESLSVAKHARKSALRKPKRTTWETECDQLALLDIETANDEADAEAAHSLQLVSCPMPKRIPTPKPLPRRVRALYTIRSRTEQNRNWIITTPLAITAAI